MYVVATETSAQQPTRHRVPSRFQHQLSSCQTLKLSSLIASSCGACCQLPFAQSCASILTLSSSCVYQLRVPSVVHQLRFTVMEMHRDSRSSALRIEPLQTAAKCACRSHAPPCFRRLKPCRLPGACGRRKAENSGAPCSIRGLARGAEPLAKQATVDRGTHNDFVKLSTPTPHPAPPCQ